MILCELYFKGNIFRNPTPQTVRQQDCPERLLDENGRPHGNPTGTYIIGKGLSQEDNEPERNFGEIRVKKISPTKVAVALYVISGAPSYDSGDFVDTLILRNNQAIFSKSDFDTSCRIYFKFFASRLVVKQTSKIHPSPCGFGWNADISGVYRKVSAKVPLIRDLTKDE